MTEVLRLMTAGGVVLAEKNDLLQAMRPGTGRILWKRELSSIGGLAAGERVYAVDNVSYRQVSATRAATGRTLWTYDADFDQTPEAWMVVADPVVSYGFDWGVRGLNLTDGRSRWYSKASGRYGLAGGDGLVAAVGPDAVTALEAGTGRTRWTYPVDFGEAPLVGAGMVFANDRFGTLHAVRAGSGERAWQKPDLKGYTAQVGGGLLYVETGDAQVLALDVETGEPVWSRRVGEFENNPRSQAHAFSLYGDTLYTACTNGTLYALNPANGQVRWTYDDGDLDREQPAAVAGLVFVTTLHERILALTPPAGARQTGGGSHAGARAR